VASDITDRLRDLRDSPPDRAAGVAAAAERYSVPAVLDAFDELFQKARV
jgi:hypothetical protein